MSAAPGLDDRLLVALGRARLGGADEARADPGGLGAEGQRHGEPAAVHDAAGGHDVDRLVGKRRQVATAEVNDGRDEDAGGDVARVSAALAALRADQVDAGGERVGHVLRRADHVHDEDPRAVEAVHGPARRDAHRRHKQPRAAADHNVQQLRQAALRVVLVGRARALADLGQQQVHAKRRLARTRQPAPQAVSLLPQKRESKSVCVCVCERESLRESVRACRVD